jgi:hypothetical protein
MCPARTLRCCSSVQRKRLFEQTSVSAIDIYTYILTLFIWIGSPLQEFYKGASVSGGWAVWQHLQATDCCYLHTWSLRSQRMMIKPASAAWIVQQLL